MADHKTDEKLPEIEMLRKTALFTCQMDGCDEPATAYYTDSAECMLANWHGTPICAVCYEYMEKTDAAPAFSELPRFDPFAPLVKRIRAAEARTKQLADAITEIESKADKIVCDEVYTISEMFSDLHSIRRLCHSAQSDSSEAGNG
jgi:hypothetical protein